MISLSQAYVLRKIWGRKTNNKSYLKCLLNSWTFHLFLKNNLNFFLRKQGIISYLELSHFKQKNWQEWINHFNRYNLSPKVWYGISPQKWRFEVNEHWKKKISVEKTENSIISEQIKNPPIFCVKFSMKSTKKSNKLFENTLLSLKFLDSNKNSMIHRFSKLNEKYINSDIVIDKIHKYPFVSKRKNFFEYNLLLWFIPEFVEQKKKYKKIVNFDNSIVKYKNLQMFHKKELFKERELNQPIRQWRWKYRNYEKKFKKLGNMASLMTFMQNQETMISLSEKMRKDLNLFRLFFRRNNHFNGLATNSEHRLPRLLNDQILIYKLIGTSLNFKRRLKKISDLDNIDECSSKNIILKDKKTKIRSSNSFFNLEDILLPKRRREFRILNSLVLEQEKNIETLERANPLKNIREPNDRIVLNTNKIIKRFIWPSYRFEDLACMNRFWLGTMNGSRFSLLRFRMYPLI